MFDSIPNISNTQLAQKIARFAEVASPHQLNTFESVMSILVKLPDTPAAGLIAKLIIKFGHVLTEDVVSNWKAANEKRLVATSRTYDFFTSFGTGYSRMYFRAACVTWKSTLHLYRIAIFSLIKKAMA